MTTIQLGGIAVQLKRYPSPRPPSYLSGRRSWAGVVRNDDRRWGIEVRAEIAGLVLYGGE